MYVSKGNERERKALYATTEMMLEMRVVCFARRDKRENEGCEETREETRVQRKKKDAGSRRKVKKKRHEKRKWKERQEIVINMEKTINKRTKSQCCLPIDIE